MLQFDAVNIFRHLVEDWLTPINKLSDFVEEAFPLKVLKQFLQTPHVLKGGWLQSPKERTQQVTPLQVVSYLLFCVPVQNNLFQILSQFQVVLVGYLGDGDQQACQILYVLFNGVDRRNPIWELYKPEIDF